MISRGEFLCPILCFMALYGPKSHNPRRLRLDQNFRYNLYLLATLEGSGGANPLTKSGRVAGFTTQGSHMQKRQTTSPFGCPPSTGRSISSALSILHLFDGGGPSKLSAITSKLLSERMVSSKNDSIVPSSVWKNIYGNTNRHLAIRACNMYVKLRSERLTNTFFSLQPSMLKLLFVYLFRHNCMVFRCFIGGERSLLWKSLFRFKMHAQSTFRRWYHRPFYTPPPYSFCIRLNK